MIGEESRRVVMLGGYTPESSALATTGNFKLMGSKVEEENQKIKIHFGVITVTNHDIHVNLDGNSMASLN